MGGGEEEGPVANESQNELSTPQNGEAPMISSFRQYDSIRNFKSHRKRATLTPDDFLAHAFGLEYAVSVSRDGGIKADSSTSTEAPGTPVFGHHGSPSSFSSSSRGSGSTASRPQNKSSGGVLPKKPPRGTFCSVRRSSRPKDIPSPSSSNPPSPVLPDLHSFTSRHNENPPTHLLSIQDGSRIEPIVTREEWIENTERRIERRRLRKLSLAIDATDCFPDQLPLDIDCRPSGWSMGLGLPSVNEEDLQSHGRRNSTFDGFWPTCEDPYSPVLLAPKSPMIDILELADRCDEMSIGSSPNSSDC